MTYDKRKKEFSLLLKYLAKSLDIPESYFKKAEERYQSVGKWLERDGSIVSEFCPVMRELLKHQSYERFLRDATAVLYSLDKNELKEFNWGLLPGQLKYEFDQICMEKPQHEKMK